MYKRRYNKDRTNFSKDEGFQTYRDDRPRGPDPVKIGAPTPSSISPWTTKQYGSKLSLAPVTLLLNPGEEAIKVAQPYPIINSNNPTLERKYNGKPTLNGNVLNDITINPHSGLMNEFDSGVLRLDLAYRYLRMRSNSTIQPYNSVNNQYVQAFDDGRSRVSAELWTQSSFNTSTFTSTMPAMDDSMAGCLVHYQTVLQNLALLLSKFNQTTLLQQDLINMGYDQESSYLVELFNQFGKTTFMNKWFTLAKYIEKEYFDKEWFAYVNGIANVPFRKSNSMRDPLLTTIAIHEQPDVTITLPQSGQPYWNSESFVGRLYNIGADGRTLEHREGTFVQIITNLMTLLDQHYILNWARKLYHGDTNDIVSTAATAQVYVNLISVQIDALINMWRIFTTGYADMKVFLNIARNAGLIRWETGVKYNLYRPKSTTSAANNITIRDILIATCATPSRMRFDFMAQKWVFYSIWDEYDGLPQFDLNNGGMDILFSVKRNVIGAEHMAPDALELCLPFLFTHHDDTSIIRMINRNAQVIRINALELTGTQVSTNVVLSRLIPKITFIENMDEGLINIPTVTVPDNINDDAATISAIVRLLTHLFKMGNIGRTINGEARNSTYVSPSLVCLVDGQMDTTTAEMVEQIRSTAPMTGLGLSRSR